MDVLEYFYFSLPFFRLLKLAKDGLFLVLILITARQQRSFLFQKPKLQDRALTGCQSYNCAHENSQLLQRGIFCYFLKYSSMSPYFMLNISLFLILVAFSQLLGAFVLGIRTVILQNSSVQLSNLFSKYFSSHAVQNNLG